jgi:hypothetical protein
MWIYCAKRAATRTPKAKKTNVFCFFFSKKKKENKDFFLKKEAKTFVFLATNRAGGTAFHRLFGRNVVQQAHTAQLRGGDQAGTLRVVGFD